MLFLLLARPLSHLPFLTQPLRGGAGRFVPGPGVRVAFASDGWHGSLQNKVAFATWTPLARLYG